MKRIATENRELDKFGPGRDGFRSAIPGVSEPTFLSAQFCNSIQEAILRVIEGAGLVPSDDYDQFLEALNLIAPGAAALAGPGGGEMVGYGGDSVAEALDALHLADYGALRAYGGEQQSVFITGYLVTVEPSGAAGSFVHEVGDTTSPDNGGTIIVSANGRRWRRIYTGPVNVQWFGASTDGVTDSGPAFLAVSSFSEIEVPSGGVGYLMNSEVQIQDNQVWHFRNPTIFHTDNTKVMFDAVSKTRWAMLGKVTLKGTLVTGATNPEVGLRIESCKRYRVEGVSAVQFTGKGIWLTGTSAGGQRGDRGSFSDCSVYQNTIGLMLDPGAGAEYNNWSNFQASGNIDGVIMAAGNQTFVGGNIVDNTRGLTLAAGANHCHGMFVGTNINHNGEYNLRATGITNGHTFSGCHFYSDGVGTGYIWLEDCRGITIQGGTIDAPIRADGTVGFSQISGNYITGVTTALSGTGLSRLRLLGNFDAAGSWVSNWLAPVYVRASRGATTQSVTAANTPLIFNSEIIDHTGSYDPATGKFVAPATGFYRINCIGTFTGTAMANGFCTVQVNGTTKGYFSVVPVRAANDIAVGGGTVDVTLNAGDEVTISSTVIGTTPVLAVNVSNLCVQQLN